MLVQKVIRYIESKQLLDKKEKVLVALSGGADSVALLRVLVHEGYTCVAAHCNFHLRGAESDRDEKFVCSLCKRLEVPLEVTHFDTSAYAAAHNCSIEMAARELRYRWFEEVRVRVGAAFIAVAHHKNDSVETFLLNLLRGTGIKGLRGIQPVNGRIVRPLLEVSREEIIDYLHHLEQHYVTDSTNLEAEFTRNKLRLEVLPLLAEINPSVCDTIYQTANRLSEAEEIYRAAVAEACRRVTREEGVFDIGGLCREVGTKTLLYELLSPYGFRSPQIDDVYRCLYEGESGRLFYASHYVLLRDREVLRVKARGQEGASLRLYGEIKDRQEVELSFSNPYRVFLDADRIKGEPVLRKWQSGDRFMPYGMKGFKKVRDYLRDRKLSLFQKEEQCVVCAGDDIVWLVGLRTDQRFCVTETTRRVWVLWVESVGRCDGCDTVQNTY